jgi:hypothetical protein
VSPRLIRMQTARSVAWLLMVTLPYTASGQSPRAVKGSAATEGQTAVLSRLYRDFAWEATGGDNGPGSLTFVDQPRAVLLRYLVPELATLLLKDRECASRSSAICRLDFAPLWDSQDPEVADVSFTLLPRRPKSVVAHLRANGRRATTIVYQMQATKAGWRIADIQFADGRSLRALLGGSKPPEA